MGMNYIVLYVSNVGQKFLCVEILSSSELSNLDVDKFYLEFFRPSYIIGT